MDFSDILVIEFIPLAIDHILAVCYVVSTCNRGNVFGVQSTQRRTRVWIRNLNRDNTRILKYTELPLGVGRPAITGTNTKHEEGRLPVVSGEQGSEKTECPPADQVPTSRMWHISLGSVLQAQTYLVPSQFRHRCTGDKDLLPAVP